MSRAQLDENLKRLDSDLLLISGLVEIAITRSVEGLLNADTELAQQVIARDDVLDESERNIEKLCIEFIRREAPLAGDLRRIISVLQIASEMERIGDYAEGISKITLRMGETPPATTADGIQQMAGIALKMLRSSIAMHTDGTRETIKPLMESLAGSDDEVDALYKSMLVELVKFMEKHPAQVEQCTYLLWVAHNIERMADRMVNIGERVYYEILGKTYIAS